MQTWPGLQVLLAWAERLMCDLLSACMRRRGVAKFDGGVPMRMNSVRMLWGKGVRAGIYPLSDSEAYWFTTKNCPVVSHSGLIHGLQAFRACQIRVVF